MIYKVYYQDTNDEYPVRERTKSLYLKADSKRDVLRKLESSNYNIEYIQALNEAHLAYEKQSGAFTLENV